MADSPGSALPARTSRDLLQYAIEVRQSSGGEAYMKWFKQLRGALADGTYATSAQHDIETVRKEAEHRLKAEYSKWSMEITPTLSAGLSVSFSGEVAGIKGEAAASLAEAKLEGSPIRIGVPDWIRNWIIDTLPFGQHRKLLLRWALAQAEFRNISQRLQRVWDAS